MLDWSVDAVCDRGEVVRIAAACLGFGLWALALGLGPLVLQLFALVPVFSPGSEPADRGLYHRQEVLRVRRPLMGPSIAAGTWLVLCTCRQDVAVTWYEVHAPDYWVCLGRLLCAMMWLGCENDVCGMQGCGLGLREKYCTIRVDRSSG